MIKLLTLFLLFFSQILIARQPAWPEITRENKPWTRWWWPGNIVTHEDLKTNLEIYHEAGLGGMEITAIYGVKGQEDKFINYLSPEFMDILTYTLKEAELLDMGIDLANASGWPFGGPWVDPSDACRNISYKTYALKGGEKLSEKIEYIQQSLVRAVGIRPDITKLTEPIGTNKNLQLYALDQIRFERPLPLYSLIAYSDSGKIADLTANVSSSGELEWIAPPGNWTLYALFQGWHGKMVERAGPGGEGDVIDHFSGRAVDNYLCHFNEIFKDYDLSTLRGYFNDSYEVDDASGQADWTADMFYEFRTRNGYDLAGQLPALLQKDIPEKNARVLSDYRKTISDLLLEKFAKHWTEWAHKQGKTTRYQAHGSPGNILDLYAASDIPETEGNELTMLKFASSAANVTGRKYSSCEAATWLGEHFTSTLADVKKAADLFFLAGINQLFYHGTCYSPVNETWPGFLFYASVEFSPANPFWHDFKALNNYIARVQSFMQSGRPDNDVLLYFPVYDRYADYERGMLEHFSGISPAYKGTPFRKAVDIMLGKGYFFDYISDLQIKNTKCGGELLLTEGNEYKTLVLPGCNYVPIETFAHILDLANEGAKILIYGNMPENVSGWADLEEKTSAFIRMKEGLRFNETGNAGVKVAALGKGSIFMGDDLEGLLRAAGISRESMADSGIKCTRREHENGFYYFVSNQGGKSFDGWIPLSVNAKSAALFNPATEQCGVTKCHVTSDGNTEVYLRLMPEESFIISTSNGRLSGSPYIFYNPVRNPVEITGSWKAEFLDGGPAIPASLKLARPALWTNENSDEYKDFSGRASYAVTFSRPAGKADAWLLSLGRVCESASVFLNGKEIAILTGPEFHVVIDRKQLKKVNFLEIKVSNLMWNRIAYLDRNKVPWKKFYNINFAARLKENTKDGIFDASSWKFRESGLAGPVTLTPLKAAPD